METQLPNPPILTNPYRSCGTAVMILTLGVIVFTVWSFLQHLIPLNTDAPLLNINGYPISISTMSSLAELLFLIIMAAVLVSLFRRAKLESTAQVDQKSAKLKRDLNKLEKRESELEKSIRDLERFNAVAMGREHRILELKDEVNALLQEQNKPNRYNTSETE